MKTTRIRKAGILFVVLGGIVAAGGPSPARAHTAVDLRGGYVSDLDEGFVGGGFLLDLARRWDFNPNLEWVLVDSGKRYSLNADVHRDLNPGSGPAIWLGAGPAFIIRDPERGDTDADLGLNLFGGLGAKRGSLRPFSQFKLTFADDSEASLAVGLRF